MELFILIHKISFFSYNILNNIFKYIYNSKRNNILFKLECKFIFICCYQFYYKFLI